MAELLLQQAFRADDPSAATAAVQAVFGVGTMTCSDARGLEYAQRSFVDDGISATRIESAGSDVRVHSLASPDLVVFSVREGSVELRQDAGDRTLGQGDLGLVCMGGSAELRWDRVSLEVFSFPASTVARLLGLARHPMRLACARLTPSTPALCTLWHRQAGVLAGEVLRQRELYESDVIREQAIDALLAVAVEAFGISDVGEDESSTDRGRMASAESFMLQRITDPITMPDVARAAGMSLRGLELLFRRLGKGTPLLHLRQLRMESARASLRAASHGSVTVGSIARGLSYTNLGRFSAHYRDAFGEAPAESLRAARAAQR